MASRRRKKSKRSNAGCLIWLIGFSIVAALFALNYGTITTTLEKTKFFDAIKSRSTTTTTSATAPAPQASNPSPIKSNKTRTSDTLSSLPQATPPQAPTGAASGGTNSAPGTTNAPGAQNSVAPSSSGKSMSVSLFFVSIADDGTISRKEVRRTIPTSDSPLSDALSALLAGPTESELRDKLMSLIPSGTRIKGINVRGGTATIDFNDNFNYNHYGVEGYAAQLKQVVYTATSFPEIQNVQVMIDGKIRDYLGSEGVFIGKPLSRSSFQ